MSAEREAQLNRLPGAKPAAPKSKKAKKQAEPVKNTGNDDKKSDLEENQ